MNDLVREYFPGAPEKCWHCPGLEAAARNIQLAHGIAATSMAGETHPIENDFDIVLNTADTDKVVSAVTQINQGIHSLAEDLYKNCTEGAAVSENYRRERLYRWLKMTVGIRVVQQQCRSKSPLRALIPIVLNRPVVSTKTPKR